MLKASSPTSLLVLSTVLLGAHRRGSDASVIAGLIEVHSHMATHGERSVCSLSLGGGDSQSLDNAVNNMVDSGTVVVVAAGNSNNDACTGSPARAQKAITVGATGR